MHKPKLIQWALALVGLVMLAGLFYQLPPIHRRLSWRVDFALTYLRGVVDPVQAVPTALPQPRLMVTKHPTSTPPREGVVQISTQPEFTETPAASATPTPSPTPIPPSVSLTAPQWEKQDINNCGPATLSMYLRFFGWDGDQFNIAELLKPQREDRNVNVEELGYYVRTQAGWLSFTYRVGGDIDTLKRLLAAGFPVMIEESFAFPEPYWPNDDLWAAHYNLLTGYDDASQTFIAQDSFYGANRKVSYQNLDRFWQSFNRVYILVYLPEQENTIKNILGQDWDADANRQHALQTAQTETQADPQNGFAWFNLGSNLVYFERYSEAAQAYDTARQIGLPQRMLRYQFGPFLAYFHSGRTDDLLALSEYALRRTPNAEEALLWHGWAMYRLGKSVQAVEDFQKALKENPGYQDAQYALNFVQANP